MALFNRGQDDDAAFLFGSAQLQVPIRHGAVSVRSSVLEDSLEEFCKGEDGGFRQAALQFCLHKFLYLALGYLYGVPEVGNEEGV